MIGYIITAIIAFIAGTIFSCYFDVEIKYEEESMNKLWIARTPNNGLYIFINKPFGREDLNLWCEWRRWATNSNILSAGYVFDSDLFLEVTFENSPMEVELKLIEK